MIRMGKIKAVCISENKGTQKTNIGKAELIADFGLEGDAHAGRWHRQVSLLSYESIEAFRRKGADVTDGAFGENLVVEGVDLKSCPVGTKLKCREVVLEVTQIGKECHHGCRIFKELGDCIMPREGIFAKVLTGGQIKAGDLIHVIGIGESV